MEEDIQDYSPFVMFRGSPCMSGFLKKKILNMIFYQYLFRKNDVIKYMKNIVAKPYSIFYLGRNPQTR